MDNEQKAWRLGQTSAWFETRGHGAGTVSTGQNDHGGVSYGEYQLSSSSGTVREYLEQSKYKKDFDGLTPGTDTFSTKWKEMAKQDGFVDDQHDFIKRTHYDVQVAALKRDGLDLTGRGPAVQDALWSTAVQTRNLTVPIFEKGLKAKFGDQYELAKLSDKDIVEAVQDYKHDHTETLFRRSPLQWEALKERALQEKADLVQFAETGIPVDTVARAKTAHQATHHAAADRVQHAGTLREHDHGAGVHDLQTKLAQLGLHDAHGRPIVPDSDFGPGTKAAVEQFQRAHHMTPDGVAGPKTLNALRMAVHPPQPTLADATHPGNGMYRQALDAVHRLDAQQGRAPDQRSDNLAAALAVAAHSNGMSRVDHVVLSDDASRAYAVQGDTNSLFKRYTDVNVGQAIGTPLAQSSGQWQHDIQQPAQTQNAPPMQQMQNLQMDQPAVQRSP
ncbi:peptidoglycan-binding protein [Rhodanobacter panaciterrae]|uniref:Peptidoglycan-binding protein n=1 Tax=Rhodanobacter panaciterrae TaxID=490572 RepID=A0ABQ2ZJ13_9GAMM|nr:peptidoglycan-binding protein [Rhodanobacter panaciterrae]GGY17771.1 peptidoglycan-binding protein [Rhodanobacter panaciterrae]